MDRRRSQQCGEVVFCIVLCFVLGTTQGEQKNLGLQGRTRGQPVTGKSVQGPLTNPPIHATPLETDPFQQYLFLGQLEVLGLMSLVPPLIQLLTCCDNFWRLIKLFPASLSSSLPRSTLHRKDVKITKFDRWVGGQAQQQPQMHNTAFSRPLACTSYVSSSTHKRTIW